ncbi:MAG TPA: hypothetical protein VK589_30000 [Chryseolinea sp.]|nr:hypothetical protein [Chryseolinea sp.]
MKIKEAGETVLKFGSGAAGLTVGAIAMKKVNDLLPASFPDIAKKIGPGLAAMLLAYLLSVKVSNDKLKALAMGLGLAGFADFARKLLGDKVSLIANNVPALSGMPGYRSVNTGGVGWDYYRDNSLQGLGQSPYALNGDTFSMQGYSMQGLGNAAYALNGPGGDMSAMNSYALNG